MKSRELGYRSYGLELTGPRVARSSIAVLDHYPKSERLILSDLSMPGEGQEDQDQALIEYFAAQEVNKRSLVATNAPLSFPPLFAKKMGVSGALVKEEQEWLQNTWHKLKPQPRPFLNYVHRPVEIYLRHLCPERFAFADSLGSNQILLAARMLQLKEHIRNQTHECFPRVAFLRICKSMRARSFIWNSHSSLSDGLEARKDFMQLLQKKIPKLFIFDESLEMIVLHLHAFHAFILALSAHLYRKDYCERPPVNYPKKSHWMLLPKATIDWDRIV